MNPSATQRFKSDKVYMLMTLLELKKAIRVAKSVVVRVCVTDFYIEVPVAKTKVIKALDDRIKEWESSGYHFDNEFEAEWDEDIPGRLLIGEI